MRTLAIGLLCFVLWVYAEVSLLFFVADETNLLFALLLTIVLSIAGLMLARAQGWQLMARVRAEVARGEVPVESLLSGVVLFLAGVLLLVPGLLTDIFGLLLLLPPVRLLLARFLRRRFEQKIRASRMWVGRTGGGSFSHNGDVVDSYAVPPPEENRPAIENSEKKDNS